MCKSHSPIWRRVLLPAATPLEEVHRCIQLVFGWEDAHPHRFTQGHMVYQTNPKCVIMRLRMMMRVEDSCHYYLRDLLNEVNNKMIYEYDLVDLWRHQIVLEKIIDPALSQSLPCCLKGKGACPPEACGGMSGYYKLLEQGDASMDPAAFDCATANTRLRRSYEN